MLNRSDDWRVVNAPARGIGDRTLAWPVGHRAIVGGLLCDGTCREYCGSTSGRGAAAI